MLSCHPHLDYCVRMLSYLDVSYIHDIPFAHPPRHLGNHSCFIHFFGMILVFHNHLRIVAGAQQWAWKSSHEVWIRLNACILHCKEMVPSLPYLWLSSFSREAELRGCHSLSPFMGLSPHTWTGRV